MLNKIRQQELNALVSMQLHEKRIDKLRQKNLLIEFLSLAVPVFYIFPRFLVKGTTIAIFIDALGELLAATLLVLVILKLVYRWQDNEIRHSIMLRKNREIAFEADQLFNKKITDVAVIEQFLRRVSDVDNEDDEILGKTKIKENQEAYREALKKLDGKSAVCEICGASPWNFIKGSCSTCGGQPKK